MILENLTIRAAHKWENQKGYVGEITFAGPLGKVQIQTGDELSRRILKECAEELVAASRQVAHELTVNILDQVAEPAIAGNAAGPAIEDQTAEGDPT